MKSMHRWRSSKLCLCKIENGRDTVSNLQMHSMQNRFQFKLTILNCYYYSMNKKYWKKNRKYIWVFGLFKNDFQNRWNEVNSFTFRERWLSFCDTFDDLKKNDCRNEIGRPVNRHSDGICSSFSFSWTWKWLSDETCHALKCLIYIMA